MLRKRASQADKDDNNDALMFKMRFSAILSFDFTPDRTVRL